jgi:hypothetical protein
MASNPNTFSITPLPVVITPNANTKVMGAPDPIPLTTYTPVPDPANSGGAVLYGTALGRVAGELPGSFNYTLGSLSYGANYSLSLGGANQFSIYLPVPVANTATSVTPVSFNAHWNTYGGATGYFLDVSTSNVFATFVPGFENKNVGNVTSYEIKGLAVGTMYYYRVRANSVLLSANSNVITVFTLAIDPTVVNATNITTTSFNAKWLELRPMDGAPSGSNIENPKELQSYKSINGVAGGYFLDVATDSNFTRMLVGFNNKSVGNVLSYNVTGLTRGTTYYYRMRYIGTMGNSNNSNIISVTTTPEVPVIANLGINILDYTAKQSDLVLTDSLIVRDAGASVLQMAVITISGNYVKSEDQLVFTNSNGLSGFWNNETGVLTINGSSNPLNYETVLRAVKYRNNSLTPSTLNKVISFVVYNSGFGSNILSRSVIVSTGNIAPVISNLEKNTLTYLKGVTGLRLNLSDSLVVTDSDNYYLNSATVKFAEGYIKDEDFFDFNNTTLLSGSFNNVNGTLTITGKETVSGYQKYLRDLTYRNNIQINGTSSKKKVELFVSDGLANSLVLSRSLEVKSPVEAPTELIGAMAANKVTLSWKDNSSTEQGYAIERSEGNNTVYSEIARLNSNIVSYSDLNIVNCKKYYYRFAAFNGAIKSDYSNEISVVTIVVGINDLSATPKNFILNQNYPNPFNPSTLIVYGLPSESKVSIQIFNSIGQIVGELVNETKSSGNHSVRWNADKMSSGVYFCRIHAIAIDGSNQFIDTKRMIFIK